MPRKVKLSSRSHSRKAIASVTRVLVERHRRVAELRDRLVEAGQHRLPVADRRAHLAEHLCQPLAQRLRPVLPKAGLTWTWMTLTPFVRCVVLGRAAVAEDLARRRPCRAAPTMTGWVTSIGSPALSVISPSTESNRNGMLSLTTVITVTGRPSRTMPGSVSMAMTLSPLRAVRPPRGRVAAALFEDRPARRRRRSSAGARASRWSCEASAAGDLRLAVRGLFGGFGSSRFAAMAFVPPAGMLLRAIVADRTRLATRIGACDRD